MPLLNYTTRIPTEKTVGEIQSTLARHGAKAIIVEYDDDRLLKAISFRIASRYGDLDYRLPVDPERVLVVLERQEVDRRFRCREHAIRVAWRIIKDWVEAQVALLTTEMADMEQLFLPGGPGWPHAL